MGVILSLIYCIYKSVCLCVDVYDTKESKPLFVFLLRFNLQLFVQQNYFLSVP